MQENAKSGLQVMAAWDMGGETSRSRQRTRALRVATLAVALAATGLSACHKTDKHANPIANVDSKQPDKVLFDRAMDALAHRRFDVARITLQTLINTYPDSEFIARAKLGVADSWYKEGTNTSLQQAEAEYKDFITFFPNMSEAAEAQMKVAGIHYKQMEKPDRDYTQAKRAEDEYRQMIQQFPDSTLVPEAKQRLREVQEVLARREFEIGRFYYMRESWAAATARLKSLTDAYPLFSDADEALYLLGQAYETQMSLVRRQPFTEAAKARLLDDLKVKANDAYARIVTRYPEMSRAKDAKQRLQALGLPVPTPTAEAIAQNKEEQKGREELGRFGKVMGNFHKHPDVTMAAKNGEPTMTDPKETNATDIVRSFTKVATEGNGKTGVEVVKPGAHPNDAPPRADQPQGASSGSEVEVAPAAGAQGQTQGTNPQAQPTNNAQPTLANPPEATDPNAGQAAPAESGIPELKPTNANPPAQGSDTGAAAGTPGPNGTPGADAGSGSTGSGAAGSGAATSGAAAGTDANGTATPGAADANAAATPSAPAGPQESTSKKKKKKH